ncbi:MAG: hypothetical protein FWF63_04775 [Fibromonadales bacterium]|nr:hypothetical protein [Fibromonadales bacterium]
MEKKDLTAADVWAKFAETDRKIAEIERIFNEKFERLGIRLFRTLFPDYAHSKIYLGIAATYISDEVAEEAKKLGIGLLRQVGETVEYETNWVRVY